MMKLATVFGVGYLKPMPGTWGSLATLPLFAVLHLMGGPVLVAIVALIVSVGGIWVIAAATRGQADHDLPEIVIDEVAGQLIALLPVSIGAAHAGAPLSALWPGWITAFVLFRLFDMWKPGPVGWADRQGAPWAVMLDDIIAGIMAAIGVMIGAFLAHGVFGA